MSSTDVSPSATPSSTPLVGTHAPKFGTVIPSRIFVGGIAANTAETELKQYFSAFGPVKDAKIIADRAGVSKGYGFVTFENQEDADRIIKKESDNLIFKDRKLNIGPAVRKQVLPRPYDSSIPPGTVLFSNGVPYTYQNGMAIFQSPEGSYQIPQPQASDHPAYTATVMMPQAQTVYMAPQYSPYQQTTPQQWGAQPAQWRWGPQSPSQQALASNPGYVWAAMHSPDLMYAQPPQAYQTAELDPTFVDGSQVEGSVIPVEQSLATRMHTPVSEVSANEQTSVTTVPVIPMQTPSTKAGNMVANYKKPYALTRRSFNTPTILVKHGHKVQRVMVSSTTPSTMYGGQVLNPSDTGDDGYIRYTSVQGHSATN
ncbi:protein boule-like isoform X2 [Littorina saxatilis]|uniref:protein boule-like isoform X2 n=1 Tax=Littorina saxatilis TaxID=31220 RepID=UPI0038B6A20E